VRRTTALAVPVLVLAAGAAALAPASQARTSSAPSFGVPRIVDPIHVYGEPNLEVNPRTGAVHATGPQGTGTQRSIWNVSVDGGDSYRIVQNLPGNDDRAYLTGALPTKSAMGPGGGDTEIKISHDGRAWFNDLAALASFTSVTTTDDGATTSVANPLGIPKPLGDRQWMALFDPKPSDHTISPYQGKVPLDYMEYADQVNGDDVGMSTDGINYDKSAGVYANDGVHIADHGVPLVDQHTGRFLGMTSDSSTVFPPQGAGTPAKGALAASTNSLALVVGVPGADGTLAYHYNTIAKKLPGSPETLFPVLAQDGSRDLYAVWIEDKTFSVWYSWAAPGKDNEWKSWHAPIKVNRPPANVNVFPWIAAGKAPGLVDIAWYGTKSTLKELGSAGPSAKKGETWDLWFAQVDHASSRSPHVVQVKAAPHPMHYNDICLLGTKCITGQGNRNQADFFKMTINPRNGRAMIIYTDSSNRLSEAGGTDTAADHQGAALDTVVTQNTGLSVLTGKPLDAYESTAPVSSITDPARDALFKPLGGVPVPGADIRSVRVSRSGSDIVLDVRTAGPLSDAAIAAKTPTAQIVVRWQMGDVLYFAAAESTAAGAMSYYGGNTNAVDLCSVSGCKPNYLTYNAYPAPGVTQASGSADANHYIIRLPLSAVGNPSSKSLLEEVMAFVTTSPQAGVVPQNNGTDFADVAPLQLEGTKTFNARFGAPASTGPAAPLAGVAVLGGLLLARRRRTG
jgi:hypothetical protein